MDIALLVLDLDGTIIPDLHTLPPQMVEAVQAVMATGVQVTIATGREYHTALPFVQKLGLDLPFICYQGGLIKDHRREEVLLAQWMNAALSRAIIKFARQQQFPMIVYLEDEHFIELPSAYLKDLFRQLHVPFVVVNNLLSILDEDTLPLKFMIVQPLEETDAVFAQIKQAFGDQITLVKSRPDIIEMTHPQVSKGYALRHLTQALNIPLSKTMVIGDQDNDISMLEIAGLSVAMGNASEGAKAVADVIAPSIEENGAIWAMTQYLLA